VKVALLLVTAALALAVTSGVARADDEDLIPLPPAEPADPRGPEPPVMVVSPPPPVAGARAPERPPPRVASKLLDGGVEITLGTLLLRPSLGAWSSTARARRSAVRSARASGIVAASWGSTRR